MPSSNFNADVAGHVTHIDANWDTCHDAPDGTPLSLAPVYVGYETTWRLYRFLMRFDTRAVSGTVNQAILYIWVTNKSAGSINFTVQKGTNAPTNPLDQFDYLYTKWTGAYATVDWSTLINGQYNAIGLNIGAVTKKGYTGLGLLTTDVDIADVQPSDNKWLQIQALSDANPPYLNVDYTPAVESPKGRGIDLLKMGLL